MDWIRKLEEEKRAAQQRYAQTQATELKRESEESERFQIVKDKLRPVIEATIAELKKRTGFELQMNIRDTSLIVSAPHPKPERFEMDGAWYVRWGRITDHRFIVSNISDDRRTVRIEVIKADTTNAAEEKCPDELSMAEWRGMDETMIDTRNDIDRLVSEDIHLLLEWLVREEMEKNITPPELSGVRQWKEQEIIKKWPNKCLVRFGYFGVFITIMGYIITGYYLSKELDDSTELGIYFLLSPIFIWLWIGIILYRGFGIIGWIVGKVIEAYKLNALGK